MHVIQNLIFVYLVTELIEFHGQQKIMIACNYNFIYNLDAYLVISIIIKLIVIYAKSNALLALPPQQTVYHVKELIELPGVQLISFVRKLIVNLIYLVVKLDL